MKKSDRLSNKIFILLFLIPTFTFAAWFKVHDNIGSVEFNQGFSYTYDLSLVYAVATDGWFYSSNNQGKDWQQTQIEPGKDLYGIGLGQTTDSSFIFVCGANGALARYDNSNDTWRFYDYVTTKDLFSLHFNYSRSEMWVGGDSNFVAISNNANDWEILPIADPLMKIKQIYSTYEKTILLGDDSQNIYIHYLHSYPDSMIREDTTITLRNYRIIAIAANGSGESGDNAVFLSQDLSTDEFHIMQFSIYDMNPQIQDLGTLPFGNGISIGVYVNYQTYSQYYWVGTSDGEIWESIQPDYGAPLGEWRKVYHNPDDLAVRSFLSGGQEGMRGMAFGDDELVLLNSFQLKSVWPAPEVVLSQPENSIRLQFSAVPDLQLLSANTTVFSNYSGLLHFSAAYDPLDSTTVELQINRTNPNESIADEIWNIGIGRGIHALGDTTDPIYLTPTQFSCTFGQMHATSFAYEKSSTFFHTKSPSTNWVAGFFNQDDLLDLVTFSNNTLYCYYRERINQDSVAQRVFSKPFPQLISPYKPIRHQLLIANLNDDDLPDLIIYDEYGVHFLINNSSGGGIDFILGSAQYQARNIRQVVVFNDNNNNRPDLLVLANSLTLLRDVSPNSQSFDETTMYFDANDIQMVAVGNVDDHAPDDLVMVWGGKIVYRPGDPLYGIQNGNQADTLTSDNGYYRVALANLNNDNRKEIIAMSTQGLDVIPPYHNVVIGPTIQANTHLITFKPIGVPPSDFIIQDFGGDPTLDKSKLLDIALLHEDSLFVYQNQTEPNSAIVFSTEPVFKTKIGSPDFPSDRLSACDYDARGTTTLIVSDYETGLAELYTKPVWKPNLQVAHRDAHEIQLQWDVPPTEAGELDHYVLSKSVDGDSAQTLISSNDNFYTDNDVYPYHDYSYTVYAVFQDQSRSLPSNRVKVSTYRELSPVLSGVLSDTTLPYWAKTNVIVPAGDSLRILPGIHIEFDPEKTLEIEGRLLVTGDSAHMVEFVPRDSSWNGILLLSAPDTVRMVWFDIDKAQVGIEADGRPFRIKLCGIQNSMTAIQATNSAFFVENMLNDSCEQTIAAGANTQGFIKNVTILHSRFNSIAAKGDNTELNIRNAIIWFSQGPILAEAQARIRISYSTVDSIGLGVFTEHISHLAPRFSSDMNEEAPYRLDPMSPTIDAGDPNDQFDLEPEPNGGRINQGVFGNTPFATPSLQPRIHAYALRNRLQGKAQQTDSTIVYFKNWGYAPLDLQDVRLLHSQENGPFIIEHANVVNGIGPQDSLPVKLWFRPPKHGTYTDTLLIACNDPHLKDGQTFVSFEGFGLNTKPHILNEPPTQAFVDSPYVFKPIVQDADSDSVVITVLQKPAWLTWTKGLLHGKPAESDTGMHPVGLKLDDQFGGVDTLRFVIEVKFAVKPVVLFPVLKVTRVGNLISPQAAMRFNISVFDSTEDGTLTEAAQSYRLRISLRRENGADTLRMDTTAVDQITFTRLTDGKYTATFTIFKRYLSKLLHKTAVRLFTIKASSKTSNRFRWAMVSLPRQQTFDLQTLHVQDSTAVLFRWNPQTEKYDPMNEAQLTPGSAFWVMPLKILTIDLNPFPIAQTGEAMPLENAPRISLQPGWNQVGLPMPYFERWIDCRIMQGNNEIPWEKALSDSLITPAVYWFEQSKEYIGYHAQAIDSNTVAIPWRGYWMYSRVPLTLYLPTTPYFPGNDKSLPKLSALMKVQGDQNAFLMNLTLACDNYRDDYNVFGLSSRPVVKLPEPPYFKDFVALAFRSSTGSFCKEVKPMPETTEAVTSWRVTVQTTQTGKEHRLQWAQTSTGNELLYVYLVDEQTETVINMNEKSEYVFTPGKPTYRFRIYASKDNHFKPAIIPLQYTVTQNYPNPFNPKTTIRVGIPESGKNQRVTLKIYDVLGKEVKTLIDGQLQPGYHKFEWDGTNAAGNAVSSGIYFYQLHAGHTAIMRKMILLR